MVDIAYDELLKLVKKRRSIRRLKPDPVPDEYIKKIIEVARWAMSGANGQPWEFIIVKDQETKNKIGDIYGEFEERQINIERTRVEELRHNICFAPSEELGIPLKKAPVLIVVCGDPRTFQATILHTHFYRGEGSGEATYLKNIANATQNLHLAAAALGLGSQWVSITDPIEIKLKALLGVPEFYDIHTIVPVGYPAYEPPPPYRRELEEIIHLERFEQSKLRSDEEIREFLLRLRKRTRPAYPVAGGKVLPK